MDASAISIFIWGIYIIILGSGMALIPAKVLPLFGFEPPKDFWIRILGLVIIALGYYYIWAALNDFRAFYLITVWGRYFVAAGDLIFVLIGKANRNLVVSGLIEAAGATWTLIALG